MSVRSLADALKDFGAGPPCAAEPFAAGPSPHYDEPPAFPDFPPMPEPEPIDVEGLVAEAVAEAEERLSQRLAEEHAAALRDEQGRHAAEIEEMQRRFAGEAADKIRVRLDEMEARLGDSTVAVAARILGAILSDDLRDRSIARLAELVREAMRDGEAARIRVHGNLPLFETLKQKLPDYAGQFDFMESPDFDISVTIDESIYETRLAEWSAALAEILA